MSPGAREAAAVRSRLTTTGESPRGNKGQDSQKSLVSPRLLTNINEGMGVVGGGGSLGDG